MRRRISLLALAFLTLPLAAFAAEQAAPAEDLAFLADPCAEPAGEARSAEDVFFDSELMIPAPTPMQAPPCVRSVCATGCTVGSPCAIGINPVGSCCVTPSGLHVCCLPPKQLHPVVCPCVGAGCTGSDSRLRCF